MPPARKVRASNGRHINVPRIDTIAAFIVTHPYIGVVRAGGSTT